MTQRLNKSIDQKKKTGGGGLTLIDEPLPTAPLVIPWACLCSDNDRFMIVYGQQRLSTPYRTGKLQIGQRAMLWWRRPPLTSDVALIAHFFFPDARRRDAGNYRKQLTDALSGVVYDDDVRVTDERYIKQGIDRLHPRAELWVMRRPDVEHAA